MHNQVLIFLLLSLWLIGCSDSSEQLDKASQDNTSEVNSYYAENPDFFTFSAKEALPQNLTWHTGMDLPDIGSTLAIKGGTEYARLDDFPRTLRVVGPDSNGSFRPYILDDVSMQLAHRHPDEFVFYPGLADSWAIDRATKTIYVKLDTNARWSDGAPVTSDDFMFMFFFFQSSYIVAPWYNNW